MKHWGLLTFFLALQAALIAIALAPGLITFAEVPPKGIACAGCSSPEVQAALTHAASIGRAQIQQLVLSQAWTLIGVGLVGIAVAARLVIVSGRRKNGGNVEGVANAL
jgi:hypothetical protein